MDVATNFDSMKLWDTLEMFNLRQFVSHSTHQNGHVLDLVISRDNEDLLSSIEVSIFLTDHAAIHCSLKVTKLPTGKKLITHHNFKSIDHEKFPVDLCSFELVANPEDDLNKLINQYETELSSIFDHHAPLKEKKKITSCPHNP